MKKPSSVAEFGNRRLEDESQVFEHNAWDNVEWTDEQEQIALEKIAIQRQNCVSEEMKAEYNANASGYWNTFYSKNDNKFFKDRHWLSVEFPEIFESIVNHPKDAQSAAFSVCEIGCGVGNTVFPFMNDTMDYNSFIYACDFSDTAIGILKRNPLYNEERCKAFVYDITSPDFPKEIEPGSIDVCSCVFVLSALHPDSWAAAVKNISTMLKPGGLLIFRDYGRYDLAQLRFKSGRLMEENFYVRGDGTRVYFFTTDELEGMFSSNFSIIQNVVDRRLIVNRLKKLKMYRQWIQGKFMKL